ncbi:MAG TPA: hypothetical protein VF707_20840 [Ardenticatenaceae bacterium]|jgi:hypothetical protein
MQIKVAVETADVLNFAVDVLALKYAQALHGLDKVVAGLLSQEGDLLDSLPEVGEHLLIHTRGKFKAKSVLFIGVVELVDFRYREIREFSRQALTYLADVAPDTRHLCLTLHGAGYGLDETEAFESEVAGLLDAIRNGSFPKGLERITIVEARADRAKRLRNILLRLLPTGVISSAGEGPISGVSKVGSERLRTAASEDKPSIFVAMPFDEKMNDVYHYGIQNAANAAGFVCERVDMAPYTGDIMDRVRKRISEAVIVIADLTGANPNVYLEVGYAWGCGKQTVLLAQSTDDLKFDLKGQKCLAYKNIKDLEDSLRKELQGLRASGLI